MLKNLSLITKILAGAMTVLVVMLAAGCDPIPPAGDPYPDVSLPETGETTAAGDSTDMPSPGDMPVGDAGMDSIDLAAAISRLPARDGLDDIFACFSGYWITTGDPFVGFVFDENDGTPSIVYGLFRTSYNVRGKIVDARATGTYTMTLTILIPATPATEMDDARPERTENIYVDISPLYEQQNTIKVKIDTLGNGGWYTYRYGAGFLEDAYNNWAG